VSAYFIAVILDLMAVRKYTRLKLNIMEVFIKPLISTLGMALVAKFSYIGLLGILGSKLATLIAIFLAAIVYMILLLITGSLTYEDFNLLPNGEKIAKKLLKLGILKK